MRILEVDITGYRSLRETKIGGTSEKERLGERAVIFGDNAVGKSNLLRLLDLLLVRVPRAATSTSTTIEIPEEPAALHLTQKEDSASVVIRLEQDIDPVRRELDAMLKSDRDVSIIIDGLQHSIKGKERAEVEISYSLREHGDDRIAITCNRILVANTLWVENGVIVEPARKGVAKAAPVGYNRTIDKDLFGALTSGFVRVDAPRLLHPREGKMLPPLKPGMERAHFSNPWYDFPEDRLINRLNEADRSPRAAQKFEMLRKHLLRDHHGWIGISSSNATSGESLELFLANLPHLPRSVPPLPAHLQGTGFAQKLHVLAACYLSGASVVGVEELEVNLAPKAQLELWEWFVNEVGAGGLIEQILVTSHSPIFLQVTEGVDIWRATLDDKGGTRLERMEGDEGRNKLWEHFSYMDKPLWSMEASAWQKPQKKASEDRFGAIYFDEAKERVFSKSVFEKLVEKRGSETGMFRVVKALRLRSSNPDIFRALALGSWAQGPRSADDLKIEWLEPGTVFGKRRIRVEVEPAVDEHERSLVLWVEERVKAGALSVDDVERFWDDAISGIDRRIEELIVGLKGE